MQWNADNKCGARASMLARNVPRGRSCERSKLSCSSNLSQCKAQCSIALVCGWQSTLAGPIPGATGYLALTRSRMRWRAWPGNRPRRMNLNSAAESGRPLRHAIGEMTVQPEPRSALLGAISMKNSQERADSIRALILDLESMPNARPGTAEFCAFALSGDWEMLFSSSPSRSPARICIRRMIQSFDVLQKTIKNTCHWMLSSDGIGQDVDAVIEVSGTYSFKNGGPLFEVQVVSHEIRLLEGKHGRTNGVLPDDLQAVVMDLQRSLPAEFFDPSGTFEITHLDPNFRISCMVGERLFGVRNVFTRCGPPMS
jgi:hypothetical protein